MILESQERISLNFSNDEQNQSSSFKILMMLLFWNWDWLPVWNWLRKEIWESQTETDASFMYAHWNWVQRQQSQQFRQLTPKKSKQTLFFIFVGTTLTSKTRLEQDFYILTICELRVCEIQALNVADSYRLARPLRNGSIQEVQLRPRGQTWQRGRRRQPRQARYRGRRCDTHSANFDEKVHKSQSKLYRRIGANMQLFLHISYEFEYFY